MAMERDEQASSITSMKQAGSKQTRDQFQEGNKEFEITFVEDYVMLKTSNVNEDHIKNVEIDKKEECVINWDHIKTAEVDKKEECENSVRSENINIDGDLKANGIREENSNSDKFMRDSIMVGVNNDENENLLKSMGNNKGSTSKFKMIKKPIRSFKNTTKLPTIVEVDEESTDEKANIGRKEGVNESQLKMYSIIYFLSMLIIMSMVPIWQKIVSKMFERTIMIIKYPFEQGNSLDHACYDSTMFKVSENNADTLINSQTTNQFVNIGDPATQG